MTHWQNLVEQIRTTNAEILRVAPFRDLGLVPNPAASPSAIAAAEERLGAPLPPSYRSFLLRHDGWPRFFEGASLLGTACLGSRLYNEFARAAFEAAETPEPELGPPTRRREFAKIIPFGVDLQSTTLFAFNRQVQSADGEYEIIAWINELGVRRDDFPSFLELLLELAEYELDGHRPPMVEPMRASA
jgi:hypothetical protein